MSDMHSSLDQFDAMLSSFEFADEDTLLKHDLRKGVENYNSMVRDVTECGWL